MTNYLLKRGSLYHFRRKVPLKLQAYFGRKEINKALGTSDPNEAKVLCREEAVRHDLAFAEAYRAIESEKAKASARATWHAALEHVCADQEEEFERAQAEHNEEAAALFYQTEEQDIAEHDRHEQEHDALV
ncbi:MAG TPA: DUF6538 domain-containing protein, partial [Paraburkholderia sp.]|nr:DUF6538 domain-containing protein [Paraburkholderia sp.]